MRRDGFKVGIETKFKENLVHQKQTNFFSNFWRIKRDHCETNFNIKKHCYTNNFVRRVAAI